MSRRIHMTLALSVGLLVSLWTLAGSLLLIHQSRNARLPDQVTRGLGQRPSQELLDAAQRVFYQQPGHWKLVLPYAGEEVARITYLSDDPFAGPQGEVTILMDPYRAEILRVTTGKDGMVGWLYEFHSRLLLGDQGKWWVGAMGLILLGFLVSGALMWRLPSGVGLSGLHGWIGLMILPVLIFSLVTGWLLVFSGFWTTRALPGESGSFAQTVSAPEMTRTMDFASVLDALRRHRPGCRLRVVEPPFGKKEPWRLAAHCDREFDHPVYWQWFLVGPGQSEWIRQDPEMEAAGTRLLGWVYALHTGQILGAYEKCLLVAAGGIPTLLLVTGMTIRWSRQRRLRKRHGVPVVQNPA